MKTFASKLENPLVTSFVSIFILLLSGHLLRRYFRWLRALRLPSSLLGGIVGWSALAILEVCGMDEFAEAWLTPGWESLPSFCTNIVFSCLFLGSSVPHPAVTFESPRREHFTYGLVLVFSHYVVSALVTVIAQVTFDTSLPPAFATVIPYGFAGGPVVAEAMLPLYTDEAFDYADGYTLALLSATVGMCVHHCRNRR